MCCGTPAGRELRHDGVRSVISAILLNLGMAKTRADLKFMSESTAAASSLLFNTHRPLIERVARFNNIVLCFANNLIDSHCVVIRNLEGGDGAIGFCSSRSAS